MARPSWWTARRASSNCEADYQTHCSSPRLREGDHTGLLVSDRGCSADTAYKEAALSLRGKRNNSRAAKLMRRLSAESEKRLLSDQALSQARFWIISASSLSIFLSVFSSSMLNMALSSITDTLNVSLSDASWLVSLFLFCYGLAMPVAGFAGDHWGKKRVFLMGAALFGIGSILAYLTPAFSLLLAARGLQGLGAAAMFPATVALLREAYGPYERGKAMGILGASASAGTVLGPPVSAYLLEVASYKAMFLVLLPFLVIIFATSLLTFPASLDAERLLDSAKKTVEAGKRSFIGNPRYLGTLGMVFVQNQAIYGIGVLIPVLLQRALGYTPLTVGKVMLIMPLAVVIASPLGGWWSDRAGHQWPVILGSLLFMSSVGLFALDTVHASFPSLILNSAVGGVGLGLSTGQLTLGSVAHSEARDAAKAAGLFGLSRQLGGVVGASLTPMLLSFAASLMAAGPVIFQREHGDYALTFVVLALVQALGLAAYVFAHIGVSP